MPFRGQREGVEAEINLVTDLCGWRWDFMAPNNRGKSKRNLS